MQNKKIAIAVAVVTSCMGVATTNAQESSSSSLALEEIVVTAQRREQSAQEVPLSVSAFSAEMLEKSNITEAKDFLSLSPNVGFTEDGQAGSHSVSISIRGVSGITADTQATAASVGYYVDDLNVGVTASGNVNPQLQDLERIEVLRGPQGTYFGRNALGGAVNVTTNKPNDEQYSEISVSTDNQNSLGVEGIVNIPVSDTFMLRGVAAFEESDGPVENVNPNSNNDTEFTYFRGSARWLASDSVTADFSLSYTDEDEGGDISVPSGVIDLDTNGIFGLSSGFDDLLGFFPQNQERVNHDLVENNDNTATIYNLRVAKAFNNMTLTSITGYVDSEAQRAFDQDNISADVIRRFNTADADSFTQEFRLASASGEGVEWTAGVYYANDEIDRFNSIQAGAGGTFVDPRSGDTFQLLPPIPAGFRINENNFKFEAESFAVFGEATWSLNDAWSVTAGGRYTKDEITTSAFDVVAFEGSVPDASGTEDFTNFSPKLAVRYIPNGDLTLYATYSEGYKAGGIDANNGITTDYDEEALTSFEVGFKSTLAGGRITLSGAIFSLDWDDLQVQTNFLQDPTDISSAISRTVNAATASSEGAEIEFLALVSEGFTWGINAGYIDASYGSFPNVNLAGGNVADLTGLDLPKTPDFTFGTILDYTTNIGANDTEGFVRFEWSYRSDSRGDLEGVAATQLGLPDFPYNIPSYDVANLRFGIRNTKWRVNAFIENLFEEDYYTGTSDNFGLAGIRLRPHPRVYGVKVTYVFGQ
ncbi:MAG: TonB-dependent receptor [Arenicella sp.]|nr:TonB-dependent receptor [Arenicella sp.]